MDGKIHLRLHGIVWPGVNPSATTSAPATILSRTARIPSLPKDRSRSSASYFTSSSSSEFRCQFHQHFTCSYFACRSQKCKKDSRVKQLFALLGSACVKAASKNIDEINTRSTNESFPLPSDPKLCPSSISGWPLATLKLDLCQVIEQTWLTLQRFASPSSMLSSSTSWNRRISIDSRLPS